MGDNDKGFTPRVSTDFEDSVSITDILLSLTLVGFEPQNQNLRRAPIFVSQDSAVNLMSALEGSDDHDRDRKLIILLEASRGYIRNNHLCTSSCTVANLLCAKSK